MNTHFREVCIRYYVSLSTLLYSGLALADISPNTSKGVNEMALKLKQAADTGIDAGASIAKVIGLFLGIGGLLLVYRIQKNHLNQSPWTGIAATVIGSAMYFLPNVMGMAAGSILP